MPKLALVPPPANQVATLKAELKATLDAHYQVTQASKEYDTCELDLGAVVLSCDIPLSAVVAGLSVRIEQLELQLMNLDVGCDELTKIISKTEEAKPDGRQTQ